MLLLLDSEVITVALRPMEHSTTVLRKGSELSSPMHVELMKKQYPKKSLCCFRDPKKYRRLSQTPKNPFWPKCQTQKNPSDPPVIKICVWGPWGNITQKLRSVYSGLMLRPCFAQVSLTGSLPKGTENLSSTLPGKTFISRLYT